MFLGGFRGIDNVGISKGFDKTVVLFCIVCTVGCSLNGYAIYQFFFKVINRRQRQYYQAMEVSSSRFVNFNYINQGHLEL